MTDNILQPANANACVNCVQVVKTNFPLGHFPIIFHIYELLVQDGTRVMQQRQGRRRLGSKIGCKKNNLTNAFNVLDLEELLIVCKKTPRDTFEGVMTTVCDFC